MQDPAEIPQRFVHVALEDGEEKKVRVLEGQILVCVGCCCGQVEKGFPAVPLDEFKRQWKERGIRLRIHLTISGCLGPCTVANVVLLLFAGESIWLHSINTAEQVTKIYDYMGNAQGRVGPSDLTVIAPRPCIGNRAPEALPGSARILSASVARVASFRISST